MSNESDNNSTKPNENLMIVEKVENLISQAIEILIENDGVKLKPYQAKAMILKAQIKYKLQEVNNTMIPELKKLIG